MASRAGRPRRPARTRGRARSRSRSRFARRAPARTKMLTRFNNITLRCERLFILGLPCTKYEVEC